MIDFIVNNIGSIIVGLAVLALLLLLTWKLISDKKKGKSSCGGACTSCPNAGLCHGGCHKDKPTE